MKGIDVSAYQSATFSTKSIDFVFVKATEGRSYVNSRQSAQAAHARDAGCVVGFYHFLWPGNIEEQARFFVEKCASREGDVLAVDWENTSSGTRASCAEKDRFTRAVKKLRPTHKVILYVNRDFWLNRDTTSYAGDGLWIADYVPAGKPRIEAKWLIHQYTDKPQDTNVAKFASRAAMKTWAAGRAPSKDDEPADDKPKPTPPPFPGRDKFGPGKKNRYVQQWGQQLVKKGFGKHYRVGPSEEWTDADRLNTRDLQLAHKELKGDADGLPGPLTWRIAFS
ncbi:hypothetical protein G4H13_26335 [Streptomyces rapamycinicus]|uniref:Muramidase n=2 Tax=Streptomyces rhizosphaericus TaxID=114699 RepID=A0A6G4ALX1_9ACTN|nr:hypothetical protein [Streptomyces rhizosphaericus]